MTLLYVAVIIVAVLYGLRIDNDKNGNVTKVCVATLRCDMGTVEKKDVPPV